MEKIIKIDGRNVPFKATGATIRLYRQLFGRDLLVDINDLDKARKSGGPLTADALTIFENMAYCLARQADPQGVPPTADEWLDTFNMFSIYQILPQIIDLWQINEITTAASKKK